MHIYIYIERESLLPEDGTSVSKHVEDIKNKKFKYGDILENK